MVNNIKVLEREGYEESVQAEKEPKYSSALSPTMDEVYHSTFISGVQLVQYPPIRIPLASRPIGGTPLSKWRAYLHDLRLTFWRTVMAMFIAAILSIIAGINLAGFLTGGISFLRPYLALFLSLGSVGLFAHAMISAFTIKNLIE